MAKDKKIPVKVEKTEPQEPEVDTAEKVEETEPQKSEVELTKSERIKRAAQADLDRWNQESQERMLQLEESE